MIIDKINIAFKPCGKQIGMAIFSGELINCRYGC